MEPTRRQALRERERRRVEHGVPLVELLALSDTPERHHHCIAARNLPKSRGKFFGKLGIDPTRACELISAIPMRGTGVMMLRTYAGRDPIRPGVSREPICRWDDSPCPLCDSTLSAVVAEARDESRRDGPFFAVVQCRRCRLAYTNPRPDETTMSRFEKANRSGARPASLLLRFVRLWLPATIEPPFILPALSCARVLDIAPSALPALLAPVNDDWTTTRSESTDLPEGARLDLIAVRGTLERLHRPRTFLEQAYRALTPGGQIVVRVPHRERSRSFDLPRRLTHFTPTTLTMMLTTVGLRTIALREHRRSGTFTLAAERGD